VRRDVGRWSLAVIVTWLLAGPATLFAIAAVRSGTPGTAAWGVYLATWQVAWGLAVALVGTLVGRRFVTDLRPGAPCGLAALAAGLLLAAVTMFTIHESVRLRFGMFDGDAAGWIGLAPAALVAASCGAWAMAAAPPGMRRVPAALTLVAVVSVAALVGDSARGAADGIRDVNIPLTIALILGGMWAAGVAAAAVMALREVRSAPDSQSS